MKFLLPMVLFALMSCSHQARTTGDQIVAKRAMYDFNCSADKLSVVLVGSEKYKAHGCNEQATYTLQCALGPCNAIKID